MASSFFVTAKQATEAFQGLGRAISSSDLSDRAITTTKLATPSSADHRPQIMLKWCRGLPSGSAVGVDHSGEVWMGDWVHFLSCGHLPGSNHMGEPDSVTQWRDEARQATVLIFDWGYESVRHTVDDMRLVNAESRRCVVEPRDTVVGVAMESGNAGDTIPIRFDLSASKAALARGIKSMDEMRGRAWLDRRVNEMVRLGRKAVA